MADYYDPGNQSPFAILEGMIVEKDALRVAEAIAQYDPNLYVLFVDPDRVEGISEEPYIVAEKCKDGHLRPVIKCWTLDGSVLERIKAADLSRRSYQSVLDWEENIKKQKEYRYEQEREERKDIVAHIAGMKSHYVVQDSQTGEYIHFYDDRPAKRTKKAEGRGVA